MNITYQSKIIQVKKVLPGMIFFHKYKSGKQYELMLILFLEKRLSFHLCHEFFVHCYVIKSPYSNHIRNKLTYFCYHQNDQIRILG
jgi:hypothetical protein